MQTKRVLLSIKPEFADKIFSGEKRFEFRRVIFRSPSVKKIVVYASSPVQQVIGEFEVRRVLSLEKGELWRRTRKHSGIEKEYFDEYFGNRSTGHAIEITSPVRYQQPMKLESICDSNRPPQSFCYLS
jgi:predicted transcriptional regulator